MSHDIESGEPYFCKIVRINCKILAIKYDRNKHHYIGKYFDHVPLKCAPHFTEIKVYTVALLCFVPFRAF